MSAEWTVVIRGRWYLPHLVNMLKEYGGNGEQVECRDEVIAQIESQIITESVVSKGTRPLVVIDPEDREQVERLHRAVFRYDGTFVVVRDDLTYDTTQAALREFADPKPPKPAEPTGLGAVVEDADGERFVRHPAGESPRFWCDGDGIGNRWQDIDVVRVLSEGVTT